VNAARRQLRSRQMFAALLSEVESANKALSGERLKAAIECKFDWEQELQ
jgi:hypothetical protein